MVRIWSIVTIAVLVSACGGGGGGNGPSSNADLSSLTLSSGSLDPSFSSGTLSYAASVANSVNSVTVTPTATAATSTITVNGSSVSSGAASAPITLAVGDNAIDTVVSAEAGNQKTYRVTVTRLPVPSSDADLAALSASVSELDQVFDPTLLDYSASAGYFGASTRVLAIAADSGASVSLNGTTLSPATLSQPQLLIPGNNLQLIEVTAEDTITSQTYQIEIERLAISSADQEAYIKATNPDPDSFATSIAARLDTLVAGAPFEDSSATGSNGDQSDNSAADAGAAYVYERQGSSWSANTYLKASNTDPGDFFGAAVAAMDTVIAVGAPGEQSRSPGINGNQADNGGSNVGAVYVAQRDTTSGWQQTDYVKASNPDSEDRFGGSIALRDALMLVGARFEQSAASGINGNQSDNSLADAGAAYLYSHDGSDWQQAAYLKASNTDAGDRFGGSVSLSATTLVIGATGEDSAATGTDGDQDDNSALESGAAYVFSALSGSLAQSAYLKASNTDPDDRFGAAVSTDGGLLVIGAPGEDSAAAGVGGDQADNSLLNSGAVYVFALDNTGGWQQIAYIKASNPGLDDAFGSSVELIGSLLVVGSPGEASASTGINGDQSNESAPNAGAVYVFELNNSGNWNQTAYIKASNTDSQDGFGLAVTIARDSIFAGAPGEQSASSGINGDQSDNSIDGAGAAYVLR